MASLSSERLDEILEHYSGLIEENKEVKRILQKIENNKGDYEEALGYAIELGKCLENTFKFAITDELLEDGLLPKDIAKPLLNKLLSQNYRNVVGVCINIQNILNETHGIGLKAVKPSYNQDKTDGLVKYISEKEYAKREKSFLSALSQNSMSIVDDSVHANADFQYKGGMSPKIIRVTDGKCCEWCSRLAGTYEYYKVKDTGNNVFRRHSNCQCLVMYKPDKTKAFNVWTKKEEVQKKIDKAEHQQEYERIRIENTGKNGACHVDSSFVNSSKFHERFNKLTRYKQANEQLYNEAMKILKDNNDTGIEHIVAIDYRTGRLLVKNTMASKGGVMFRCGFSDKEYETLESLNTYYEVLHNHPNSSMPSVDDIISLFHRKHQKGSTIVCHNGDVYYLEKIKAYDDIDNLANEVYLKIKEEFYGHGRETIDIKCSKKLIVVLERKGVLRYEERKGYGF